MTSPVEEVKAFILASLHQRLADAGLDALSITDDFDLRKNGVIDSLGFIQLIAKLEARFARPMDLVEVPPEQLMKLDVLSRHIAAQLVAAGPATR